MKSLSMQPRVARLERRRRALPAQKDDRAGQAYAEDLMHCLREAKEWADKARHDLRQREAQPRQEN